MKTKKSFLWLAFLILATIWILARHNQQANYYNIKGLVFGTVVYCSEYKPFDIVIVCLLLVSG